jgi:hypothetical protein
MTAGREDSKPRWKGSVEALELEDGAWLLSFRTALGRCSGLKDGECDVIRNRVFCCFTMGSVKGIGLQQEPRGEE